MKKKTWKSTPNAVYCYVGTAGHVSAETIKRYIEEQKTDADADNQGADPR